MKKRTALLLLLLLCGILFGCKLPEVESKENPLESVLSERIMVDYDSPEQLIEQMFSAIQTGDVDAFRALFAVDVQNADPELDERIREAFDFFDGALRSYEKKAGPNTFSSFDHGTQKRYFEVSYIFQTATGQKYCVAVQAYTVYDTHEDGIGMTSCYLARIEDTNYPVAFWGDDLDTPGLHLITEPMPSEDVD